MKNIEPVKIFTKNSNGYNMGFRAMGIGYLVEIRVRNRLSRRVNFYKVYHAILNKVYNKTYKEELSNEKYQAS